VKWGDPIEVPVNADGEEIARATAILENALNQITHQLDTELGLPLIEPAADTAGTQP
jgi:hypothetical protein